MVSMSEGKNSEMTRRDFLKAAGFTAGSLALASTVSFSSFGGNGLAKDQVITIASTGSDAHGAFDPARASWEYPYLHLGFNALLRIRPGSGSMDGVEKDLAEAYDISPDGKVWTFKLREGVKFSRGYGEVTAEDVKFTFDRLKTDSAHIGFYDVIENVEKVDQYTVKFYLKRKDALFKLRVGDYISGRIVSKKAYEDMGKDKFRTYAVGTGPWYLDKYESKDRLVFKRNDNYFRGKPIIEKIIWPFMPSPTARLSAMITGEIDAIRTNESNEVTEALKNSGKSIKFIDDIVSPHFLFLNTRMEPLDNKMLRKAIFYSLNRENYMQRFGDFAEAPEGIIAKNLPDCARDANMYEYDPEKAKELMKEAGYPDGFDMPKTYFANASAHQAIGLVTQDNLRDVGIKLPIEEVPYGSPYWDKVYGGDLSIGFYDAERPSSLFILQNFWHSDACIAKETGNKNFMCYEDEKTDELIEKALRELDDEKRYELTKEVQKRVADSAVWYNIFDKKGAAPLQPWVDLGYEWTNFCNYSFKLTEKSKLLKH